MRLPAKILPPASIEIVPPLPLLPALLTDPAFKFPVAIFPGAESAIAPLLPEIEVTFKSAVAFVLISPAVVTWMVIFPPLPPMAVE